MFIRVPRVAPGRWVRFRGLSTGSLYRSVDEPTRQGRQLTVSLSLREEREVDKERVHTHSSRKIVRCSDDFAKIVR